MPRSHKTRRDGRDGTTSTDPWAWTQPEVRKALPVQRLSYVLTVVENDRLAIAMQYSDGAHVRAIPYQLGDNERRIAAAIMALPRRQSDSLFLFEGELGRRAIEDLIANAGVTNAKGEHIEAGEFIMADPKWEIDQEGLQTYRILPASMRSYQLLDAGGPAVLESGELRFVTMPDGIDPGLAMKLHRSGALPAERAMSIANRLPKNMAPTPIKVERAAIQPKPVLTMDVDADGATPIARIEASYDGATPSPADRFGDTVKTYDPENSTLHVRDRDIRAEERIRNTAADAASTAGLIPTVDPSIYRYGEGNDPIQTVAEAGRFELREADRIENAGWEVRRSEGWTIRPRRIDAIQLRVALGVDQNFAGDFPSMTLDVIGDGRAAEFIEPLTEIAASLDPDVDAVDIPSVLSSYVDDGEAALASKDGRVWLIEAERFFSLVTSLRNILAAPRQPGGPIEIDQYSLSDLAEISRDIDILAPERISGLLLAMSQIQNYDPDAQIEWPALFSGDKDPDQLAAATWLGTLFDAGYSGILADDVGYGKTIELGLHIARLYEDDRLPDGAVIAVPNDAVSGWADKLRNLFPGLPFLVWHGRRRPQIEQNSIVLTSSDLIKRNDCPLRLRRWTVAALDEAQDARNPRSGLNYAMSALDTDQTIPITASPIENSLLDLWSLMNMANEGILGSLPAYRTTIANPIEQEASVLAANRLNAITAPFIMQRIDTKRPTPEIKDVIVSLDAQTQDAYDMMVGLVRGKFQARRDSIEARGGSTQALGMSVMLSLTRLRQLCCSPLLVPGGVNGPVSPYHASPKTRAIVDDALELAAEGKRVVVFSSWTGHLDILRAAMIPFGLRCGSYDGRMTRKDRRETLAAFKAGELDVILMTTKCGGRSHDINETDAIFFADPWWNPKVEKQGIGRGTRRGQTKVIDVRRYLTASPVEDAIMQINRRKDHLSDLIGPGRIVDVCDGITLEDIDSLLDTFSCLDEDLRAAA